MSTRTEKIASLIQHEVPSLLLKYFNEEAFGLITIEKIEVYDDLSLAKIYVSLLKGKTRFFKEANKKSWKIARDLAPRLKLKKTPKIKFLPKNNDDKTKNVLRILDSL